MTYLILQHGSLFPQSVDVQLEFLSRLGPVGQFSLGHGQLVLRPCLAVSDGGQIGLFLGQSLLNATQISFVNLNDNLESSRNKSYSI